MTALRWIVSMTALPLMALAVVCFTTPAFAEDFKTAKPKEKAHEPAVKTTTETHFEISGKKFTIKIVDGKPTVTVSGGAEDKSRVLAMLAGEEIEEKKADSDGRKKAKMMRQVLKALRGQMGKNADGLEEVIEGVVEEFMKSGILKNLADDVDIAVRIGDHEHRLTGRKGGKKGDRKGGEREHDRRREGRHEGREHDGMSGRWHERIERLEIANRRLTAEVERLRKRVNSASGPVIHRGRVVPKMGDRLERIEKLLEILVSKADRKGPAANTTELRTRRITRTKRTKRTDAQFLADMAKRKAILAAAKAERQSKMQTAIAKRQAEVDANRAKIKAKHAALHAEIEAKRKAAEKHNERLKASYERLREVMKKLEEQRKQLEQETKAK